MAGLISSLALVILILILIALFTPIHIIIKSQKKDEEITATAALALPKNILKLEFDTKKKLIRISSFNRKLLETTTKPKTDEEEGKPEEKEEQKGPKEQKTKPEISPREFISPAFRLLEDILKSFHYEKLTLNMDLGLKSPADTGIATGMFWAIKGATYPITDPDKTAITLTPYFQNQISDYNFEFWTNETLYRIAKPTARFIASRPMRTAISNKIRGRR